jgi:CBS domain-containing protein
MATDGPDAYVSAVMDRDFVKLNPEMDLAEAMAPMSEAGACALVMDDDRLVGMLTRENISEFLMIRKFGLTPGKAAATELA